MRSCDGSFFFFNDTATTEIYPYCHTLSLPRALPILEAHGYSSALRSQYVRAGWLESPARRVYRRSRAPLTWPQVVISLQTVLDLPLTVGGRRSEEHTSELQSLMRISYAVFCLKKKTKHQSELTPRTHMTCHRS